MDPEPSRPELISTGKSTGWKLPALAVSVVLAGLVVVGRLGPAPVPAPTAPPSPLDLRTPGSPDIVQAPGLDGLTLGVFSRINNGTTYADGIPTMIDGQPVHRVQEAISAPLGLKLLVGGWYHRRSCFVGALRCPSPTLSDVPLVAGQGDVRTDFIALNMPLDLNGAYVVQAKVVKDPRCAIHGSNGECQPRLKVLAQPWSQI